MTHPSLPPLPHHLDRTIVIEAPREIVFRFFTDEKRWASWWGAGSTIDAKPGGKLLIRYPEGTEVSGEVLEIAQPERIVFTYGYVSGQMIPPGGSLVTIRLQTDPHGTRLELRHDCVEAAVRDQHVQGWRYQLSLFGNIVANDLHGNAVAAVDEWFSAWIETDGQKRLQRLSAITGSSIRFRDRFSLIDGVNELNDQIGAAQRFMPGLRMERRGDIRQCQGLVLAEWVALTADNQERGRGTNVFAFGPDKKIEAVTGFWT
jgi:uncharacterized protein YndB with AHSA1/START domain